MRNIALPFSSNPGDQVVSTNFLQEFFRLLQIPDAHVHFNKFFPGLKQISNSLKYAKNLKKLKKEEPEETKETEKLIYSQPRGGKKLTKLKKLRN
jgi:hypothetical protein